MSSHSQVDQFQREAAGFSLFWLLAANGVGLLLASLLLFPGLGKLLGPFTYGRWMPLHMEWQLYGWCSIPLVSLLVWWIADEEERVRLQRRVLVLWSSGLVVGGLRWLGGEASGKLFLSWYGLARFYWVYVLLAIWYILLQPWWRRGHRHWLRLQGLMQGATLLVLFSVPIALWWTTGRDSYPPINPESGGATGHSLLASTLGIVFMFGALREWVLRLDMPPVWQRWLFWGYYGVCTMAYLGIEHGNASNEHLNQVFGLSLLCGWIPVFAVYFRGWARRPAVKPWLMSFLFWWTLLCISGVTTFLPQVLQVWKFTNGLVAHAHLAMAGMVTSFLLCLLGLFSERERVCWSNRLGFSIWNGALLLMVVVLGIQGWREGLQPEVLWMRNGMTSFLYGLRWLAGLCLFGVSLGWCLCTAKEFKHEKLLKTHESKELD